MVFVRGVSQRKVPMKYVNPQWHDGVLQRKAVVATRGMEPATKIGVVDVGPPSSGKTPTVVWALPEMCVWDMDAIPFFFGSRITHGTATDARVAWVG